MPKAKSDTSIGRSVSVKTVPGIKRDFTERLIASMNLDEMLDASRIVEMGFRGEKIPTVKSPKVKKYIGEVMQLNKKI